MKYKKILACGMLSFSLLTSIPFNCTAYPLQDEYIQKFGRFTQSVYGLKAIIINLNKASGRYEFLLGTCSINNEMEEYQRYLSQNFERFRHYIPNISLNDVRVEANYIKGQEMREKTYKEERERVEKRLEGFDPRTSLAVRELKDKFGEKLPKVELWKFSSNIVRDMPQLRAERNRDAKRHKDVLLKWFDDNWSFIRPYLYDANNNGNAQ